MEKTSPKNPTVLFFFFFLTEIFFRTSSSQIFLTLFSLPFFLSLQMVIEQRSSIQIVIVVLFFTGSFRLFHLRMTKTFSFKCVYFIRLASLLVKQHSIRVHQTRKILDEQAFFSFSLRFTFGFVFLFNTKHICQGSSSHCLSKR